MKKWVFKLCLTCLVLLLPCIVEAGQFSVSPVIVAIEHGAKSGSIVIGNEDRLPLQFRIKASVWTQDSAGKDMYADTDEIIFYPKMLHLDIGEQRVVRIGMKGHATDRERTYRLFIEEVPTAQMAEEMRKKAAGASGRVSVIMRIAPAIFYAPIVPKTEARIDSIHLDKGAVHVRITNAGNVHIKLQTIKMTGKASDGRIIFNKEVAGWYLLSGVSRDFEAVISPNECRSASVIEVGAEGETLNLKRSLDVQTELCPK